MGVIRCRSVSANDGKVVAKKGGLSGVFSIGMRPPMIPDWSLEWVIGADDGVSIRVRH